MLGPLPLLPRWLKKSVGTVTPRNLAPIILMSRGVLELYTMVRARSTCSGSSVDHLARCLTDDHKVRGLGLVSNADV